MIATVVPAKKLSNSAFHLDLWGGLCFGGWGPGVFGSGPASWGGFGKGTLNTY